MDIIQDFVEQVLDTKIVKIISDSCIKNSPESFQGERINGIKEFKIIKENNEKINIGIKIIDGQYIQEKILIYGTLIHANQSKKDEICKTVTINILDLDYFSTQDYHKKLVFDKEEMIFHILELPKFKKEKIESDKDAWMAYLKCDRENLVEEAKQKNKKIGKLEKILKEYWLNEKL